MAASIWNWLSDIFSPKESSVVTPNPQSTTQPDPAVLLACRISMHYEGCPTDAEGMCIPYLDPARIPTIGFGSTYYEDGSRVSLADAPIPLARAKILLYRKMEQFMAIVDQYVDAPLNQGQAGALSSFVYNEGPGRFESSTMLKYLNAHNYAGAAGEFPKWDIGGGRRLPGLSERRKTEQNLFETGNLIFYGPGMVVVPEGSYP